MIRARLFGGLALVAALSCAASLVEAGTIASREFASPTLNRSFVYNVYLPTGYESSGLRYPVLYLIHGNSGDQNDWVVKGKIQATADALIASGDIPPVIIVMPAMGSTWCVDRKENAETAFLKDLMPEIEKSFRTIARRDGRSVGGLSMGGYCSLRFALKYPELFQSAALLSPAIYDPEPPQTSSARRVGVFGAQAYDPAVWKELNYPILWDGFLKKNLRLPMYINSGDDDDFEIESEATRLYSLLRHNKQMAELRIVNGKHEWPVWETTIGDAMKYSLGFVRWPEMGK